MSEQIEKVARAIYIADSIDEAAGAAEWDTGKVCAHMVGNYFTLARAAIAALDGAPEPEADEWEYAVGGVNPGTAESWADEDDISGNFDTARAWADEALASGTFSNAIVVKRRVNPWLPVEGESKS